MLGVGCFFVFEHVEKLKNILQCINLNRLKSMLFGNRQQLVHWFSGGRYEKGQRETNALIMLDFEMDPGVDSAACQ